MSELQAAPVESAPACKPAYKRLTAADRAYILKLREQQLTQAAIAQRIGCTQQAVSDWLRQCEDSTTAASLYLRGSALRMAQNIVSKGLPRDHVAALKGINVLAEDKAAGLTIQIGIRDSDVAFACSTALVSTDIHRLTGDSGSDNGGYVITHEQAQKA